MDEKPSNSVVVTESVNGFGGGTPATPSSTAEKLAELDAWSAQSSMDPRKQELLERRMTKQPLVLDSNSFCIPDTISGDGLKSEFTREPSSGEHEVESEAERDALLSKIAIGIKSGKKKKRRIPSRESLGIYCMKRETSRNASESSCDSRTSGCGNDTVVSLENRKSQRNTPTKRPLSSNSVNIPGEKQTTPNATPSRLAKKQPTSSPSKKISDYFTRTFPPNRSSSSASKAVNLQTMTSLHSTPPPKSQKSLDMLDKDSSSFPVQRERR